MNNHLSIRRIITVFWLCTCFNLQAQTPHTNIHEQLPIRNISVEEGLVNNMVLTITQDHKGFIWAGTFNGLSRFDGLSFRNYKNNPKDSLSVSQNRINKVYCDSKQRIWVCSGGKLQLYDAEHDNFVTFVHPDLSPTLKNVTDLLEDNQGRIWFTCGSLFCFDQKADTIIQYTKEAGFPASNIGRLLLDDQQNLWFSGNKTGVYKLSPSGQVAAVNKTNKQGFGMEQSNTQVLYKATDGSIWLGSNDNGAFKLNADGNEWIQYIPDPDESFTMRVRAFFESPNGDLYIGTRNGIYLKTHDGFLRYAHSAHPVSTLNHNSIYCVGTDRMGGVWLGTFAGGLAYLNFYPKGFVHYKHIKDDHRFLNNKVVYSVLEDRKGDLWVGTETGGLNHFDAQTGQMTYHQHDPNDPSSISHNEVRGITEDSKGNLWLATNKGGVNYFNVETGKATHYKYDKNNPNSIRTNRVFELLANGPDQLWVSTLDGLDLLNTKTDSVVHLNVNVRGLAYDKKGRLWCGLYEVQKGLGYIKPGDTSCVRFPNPEIITSRTMTVFVDSKDNVWLGFEAGLALFDPDTEQFTIYNSGNGFAYELVYSIEEDDQGNLWLGTNNGLVMLKGVVASPKAPLALRAYTPVDGLQAKEFTPAASFKGNSGKLYFGGVNGLSVFDPPKVVDNPFPPQVAITQLKVFNKTVEIGDTVRGEVILSHSIEETPELILSYKHNIFSFEFSAFHFSNPNQNQYAYMMKGLDQDWNYTDGYRHFATYTSMPGGSYTFMLKAANPDGVWAKESYSLKLRVIPPWWKTLWFKILVFLVLAVMGASFYLVRVKQLQKQKRILELKVNERTRKLSEANASLVEKQEEILQQNEEIIQQNHEISRQKEYVDEKNREVQSAYQDMRLLSEFGQKISATLRIAEIGDMIYSHIAALVPLDVFGIGLYSKEHQRINFVSFVEGGKVIPPFLSSMEDPSSLAAWCIRNKKEVYSSNFKEEYGNYISNLKIKSSKTPESIINLPLITDQRTIGILTLQCYKKDAYSSNDLTNIRSLASYLAISLDNASAYQTIEKQNQHITDSINYAKTIQDAMLPSKEFLEAHFDSFVLFRPRDIVSGDFYWSTSVKNNGAQPELFADAPDCEELFFVAVVDCTGHGVPGAFMSMIGSRLLNEIVNQRDVVDPGQILEILDASIVKALKQDGGINDDGMDVTLVKIYRKTGGETVKIAFAGAKSPLYYYQHKTQSMNMVKGSIRTIGGTRYNIGDVGYDVHELELLHGDTLYLTSDGFADQQNPKRKRFTSTKLLNLLVVNGRLTLPEQKAELEAALDQHMQNEPQRDDISMLGIRL